MQVAVAEAKHRRLVQASQTRTRTTTTSSSPLGRTAVYYGKETIQSNVMFPPVNLYIDRNAITLLYQVHEIVKRNDVSSDLVDLLRGRLAASDDRDGDATAENVTAENITAENVNGSSPSHTADDRLYDQLYLASVLWWDDEQDEAVQWMVHVADQLPDDLAVRFDMAQMHEARGDYEDALLLIDSITPRDQQVLQRRELVALQLAERLGDLNLREARPSGFLVSGSIPRPN